MTDIRPSPEMLDAAAANRREARTNDPILAAPLEERDLSAAIAMHRLMFRKDAGLPLKLHQRDGDDAGLGAPFNAMFAAYLDGAVGHTDSWNGALLWMREQSCRKTHSKHWEPKVWGGSLCYRLCSHVIRWEMPLEDAMAKLGLTEEPLTSRTLDSALRVVENRLEWMLRGEPPEVRRSPAEWMLVPHEHRHPPNTSLEDCPQCRAAA